MYFMQKPTAEKKILWFQNFTCNPASNYSNSFTLVWKPQVNKIMLKLVKLLSMRTRQCVPSAWSFCLPITYWSLILFIIFHWLLAYNFV